MVLTTLQSLSGTYQGCHHTIKPDFAPLPPLQAAFHIGCLYIELSTFRFISNSITADWNTGEIQQKPVRLRRQQLRAELRSSHHSQGRQPCQTTTPPSPPPMCSPFCCTISTRSPQRLRRFLCGQGQQVLHNRTTMWSQHLKPSTEMHLPSQPAFFGYVKVDQTQLLINRISFCK